MSEKVKNYPQYNVNDDFAVKSQLLQGEMYKDKINFMLTSKIIENSTGRVFNANYIELLFNKATGELERMEHSYSPICYRSENVEKSLHFMEAVTELNGLVGDSIGRTLDEMLLEMQEEELEGI